MTITDNTVTETSGAAAAGGGVFIPPGGTLTMTNSSITVNRAEYGAGLYSYGAMTITGSTIADNRLTVAKGGGAGIYTVDTLANITNSTIAGNFNLVAGGGYGGGNRHRRTKYFHAPRHFQSEQRHHRQ